MTKLRVILLAAAALLLAGCGDDKPYSGPDPNTPVAGSDAPASGPSAFTADAPSASAPDPLAPKDAGIPTDDPLLSHTAPTQADPLAGGDPLQGRAMPTEHSHWLRGRVQSAHLSVLLNGVRDGDYTGTVDRDITMKLRAGINTVSFVYTPGAADASAQMDLVESEHHPPIAPLASFQSLPSPDGAGGLKPTTERVTFFAK